MSRRVASLVFPVLVLLTASPAAQDDPASKATLPPLAPWQGNSHQLALAAGQQWATPFEDNDMQDSPSYDATVEWLRKLVNASPQLYMLTLGVSDEGRDIWMIVASKEGAATPEALRHNGRPTALLQAGIHSGEIDGKDAGMMLLRDTTVLGRSDLLDEVNVLFVPILNVDGHERSSPYGRINQRGPTRMGWRTNARNLNLNRDYAKLDTPELRAAVEAIRTWQPDLYLDLHVTDGADYQYDVTWGYNASHAWSPAIGRWLEQHYTPTVTADLERAGHVPGPLIFAANRRDVDGGIVDWTATPRFSTGYGDARHLPTVLLENHSLKPFDRRVLGTYVFLESSLRVLARHGQDLRRAIGSDRKHRPRELTLGWQVTPGPPDSLRIRGIGWETYLSPISGGVNIRFNGKPTETTAPVLRMTAPMAKAPRPTSAYLIPPAWPEVIQRLAHHGIGFERLEADTGLEVERYRITAAQLESDPFEGHVRVTGTEVKLETAEVTLPAGTVHVPVDQPLGDLAMLLLEPQSPDSFWQWGFFLGVLQRTEYVEAYVMEPTAAAMLKADPALAAEFEAALQADSELAGDPHRRLHWFYQRTPYYDERWRIYPVMRQ